MDLYEVLGVRRGASAAEIRRAFQKRARSLHPDLNPGDPVAAERFREASRAFEVLSDSQRRAAYDRGEPTPVPVAPAAEGGFEGFDFSAQVRIERVGFREIFDAEVRGPERSDALRGEDLEQATRLSFEESLKGTERRVHLVRFEPCGACQGAGEVAFGPVPCPRCHGAGQVKGSRGHMIFSRPCAECDGRGDLRRRPCGRCGGEGRLIASEWLDVQIPPGVGDGSQVRLPGCGNAGRRNAPAGDFVLTVQVEAHPVFRREGEDLHCVVPVSMTDAALGAHVEAPTPEGPVTIELPAGTQNGQRFRLRKRGVPRLGEKGRGDLFVEARVVVPAVTEDRARELLREFARVHREEPRRSAESEGAS
ncbi:MAG TPA: J domain-containing protein [Vicinamibacteria bacterium]|nr:J domain-containing protein [Vicinamibacteria bacterium]